MSDWRNIKQLTKDLIKRDARARSIMARNREMPIMCDILGIPRKPDMKLTEQQQ